MAVEFLNSPNMNLPVPVVGVAPGPEWATLLNACMALIDTHTHAPGQGSPVTSDGVNINAALAFNSQDAALLRSSRYVSQGSPLALVTDVQCTYVSGADLYYNDSAGNQVRITQNGGIAGSPGSISNLTPPASAAYVSGTETFVFQSDVNTAANIDVRSAILRNSAASSFGLTLSPPTLSSDYSITLPALPTSTYPLRISSTGVMSAAQTALANSAKSGDATLTNLETMVSGDATGAAFTLTLPSAASNDGLVITIKKTDATFNTISVITVDGGTRKLATQGESYEFVVVSAAWTVKSHYIPSTTTSFTPTGSFTTNTTYSGKYYREGEYINIIAKLVFAGVPNSVSCDINLPTGLTLDTSKIFVGTNITQPFGDVSFRDDSAVKVFTGRVTYNGSTTAMRVIYQNVDGGSPGDAVRLNSANQANPMTVANQDIIEAWFRVPITNWEG